MRQQKGISPFRSVEKMFRPDEKTFEKLKQSVRVLIGIFLLVRPFHHFTSIEEICFYLSLFILLILIFFKKSNFSFSSPFTFPFLIFVSWSFLGLFSALNQSNSLEDFYGHLLKYLALYYLLINFFNSRKHLVFLGWIFVISAGIYSMGGTIYFYLIQKNPIGALFRIHPYMDYLYVFAFLLAWQLLFEKPNFYPKLLLIICILGTAGATLLTQTRSAFLAMGASLFILFSKNKKILSFFIIVSMGVMALAPLLGNRLTLSAIWEHKNIRIGTTYLFWEMIKDYPLTGIGFGMQTYDDAKLLAIYNQKVPPAFRQDPPIASPHNIFMDVSVRLGLAGLGFFCYILFILIRLAWQIRRYGKDDFIRKWSHCLMAAFTAFLIQANFSDATFGIQAIVFYTILAMMTILWRLNAATENPICAGPKRTF